MTHIHKNNGKVFCFVADNYPYAVKSAKVFGDLLNIKFKDAGQKALMLPLSHTWHNPKRASDLTEKQCAEIVQSILSVEDGNTIYKGYRTNGDSYFIYASLSFSSLLTSIGMREETTVILFEKI